MLVLIFQKVRSLCFRDAVEKLFPADVNRRRLDVQGDPRVCQVLQTFHQFGEKQTHRAHALVHQLQQRGFYTGVIAALCCVSVSYAQTHTHLYCIYIYIANSPLFMCVCVCRWCCHCICGSVLIRICWPVNRSAGGVLMMSHCGWSSWVTGPNNTEKHSDKNRSAAGINTHDAACSARFQILHFELHEYEVSSTVFICHMFVRLLSVLRAEDLSVEPFRIKDPLHRRAFLQEIQNIQHLRVKAPGNLWEYKVCLSQKCFNKHDSLQNDVELSLNGVLSFCLCRHRI